MSQAKKRGRRANTIFDPTDPRVSIGRRYTFSNHWAFPKWATIDDILIEADTVVDVGPGPFYRKEEPDQPYCFIMEIKA